MKRAFSVLGVVFFVVGVVFAFSFMLSSRAQAATTGCVANSCSSPAVCHFAGTTASYCALPNGGDATCNYGCCTNSDCGSGQTCYSHGTPFSYCSSNSSSSVAPTVTVPVISGVQGYNPATGVYTNSNVTIGTYLVIYSNGSFTPTGNAVTIDGELTGAYPGTVAPSYQSASQINVSVDGFGVGTHTVKVTNSAGTSLPISFTISTAAGSAGSTTNGNSTTSSSGSGTGTNSVEGSIEGYRGASGSGSTAASSNAGASTNSYTTTSNTEVGSSVVTNQSILGPLTSILADLASITSDATSLTTAQGQGILASVQDALSQVTTIISSLSESNTVSAN